MFRSIFLLFACCLGHPLGALWAQGGVFEKITIEQGLSQGMIFNILQTRDGFLWVATKDGLNRYDGYNFKVFSNNPFDAFSIAENNATVLFEDSRGWLWVGLDTKGVDAFDPKTGRFFHFPLRTRDAKIFNGTNIVNIVETADGAIWLGRVSGDVWRISLPPNGNSETLRQLDTPQLPQKKHFPELDIDENHQGQQGLVNIRLQKNGELLLTTKCCQYALDPRTGDNIRKIRDSLSQKLIARFAMGDEANDGDMWFYCDAVKDVEIELKRLRHGQLSRISYEKEADDWPALWPGKAGHVWLLRDQKIWDLAPGAIPDFSKADFVLDVPATCITWDRLGNLWVGTSGYGLRKINPLKSRFHAAAAGMSVRGLWAKDGNCYVKNGEQFSFHQCELKTGTVSPEQAFSDAAGRQISLAFEASGAIWLLSAESEFAKGKLCRYAPKSHGPAERCYFFEGNLNLFDPLLRARDGQLWIAENNGRLTCFDPATERFERFEFGHLFGENVNAVRAIALAEDGAGTLWIGTQMGLVKAMPRAQGFDFEHIQANPDNPKGLNNNAIACILPDPANPSGTLWLGTKGGGINILDIQSGHVRHITTADGLLNNVVYGILPGSSKGEFWCSTNRGLAKISAPRSGMGDFAITTFTAALGLQDNEFNTYAFCKNEAGELFFGGINGLNRFFPNELRADTTPPPVFIVDVEINHQKSGIAAPESLHVLDLSYDQNNLSLEFSALDFTDPSKNRYRYRLVGLEKDWVEAGPTRFAHYSQLPPGHYEFWVQGSNGESAWRAAAPLLVVVHPPWWRSKLAYLVYFLSLALAGWQAYRFQIKRVKEREQLAFEHRETERVKVLEQLKANFFNNVTHELRTPLTLMLEPLRRAIPKIKDPEVLDNVQLAEANSRKLLGLVNQLLDMAKIESGQMALDLRRGHLGQTVRDVFETFLPLAEKRGVKLTLSAFPTDLPAFDFDAGRVELVLNNLLSNALKFTPENGKVEVALKMAPIPQSSPPQILKSSPPQILLQVKDTGIGISPEHLDKIFDRFYQVDGSHTRAHAGTGIGLALSKELAELMGGGISVESPDPMSGNKGSIFTFWLPVRWTNDDLQLTNGASDLPFEGGEIPKSKIQNPKSNDLKWDGSMPIALIIEDNLDLRRFIRQSIASEWQVVEASDGAEGINKAVELVPDVVLSDVMMPRKDGFEVVDTLKNNELTAHIPIVLLTAKSGIESKLKGLRRGADDYLTKPFSTEELLARMGNLLETRRRLRQLFGGQNLSLSIAPTGKDGAHADFLSEPDRAFLQKFTLLLEENLDNELISVEDFAKKMLFSRSQLHRKLRALTDKSPTDFVRDYRLDRAHAMLKNREGRVGEIALRVGFGNEKYFSTAFREKFGVPPSQI